jgi:GT2 family glycosyltransferase
MAPGVNRPATEGDQPPSISLIIATHNRAKLLKAALASVAQSTVADSRQVEVIAVDNNSTDATAQVIREIRERGDFPFVLHYVLERHQGVSHARNAGIGKARGKYVVFMDDDQTMDARYLGRVESIFEKTGAACVGGPGVYRDLDKLPAWLAPLLARSVTSSSLADADDDDRGTTCEPRRQQYLIGGNMAIRRDVLDAIGGFDENLGRRGDILLAAEEFELQDRLHKSGNRVVYHSGLIQYHYLHPERRTRRYWRKRLFYLGRTDYMYRRAARSQRSKQLFHAPRWLWWSLLSEALPAWLGSRLSRDGFHRFDTELMVWQRAGQIHQARLENGARMRTGEK